MDLPAGGPHVAPHSPEDAVPVRRLWVNSSLPFIAILLNRTPSWRNRGGGGTSSLVPCLHRLRRPCGASDENSRKKVQSPWTQQGRVPRLLRTRERVQHAPGADQGAGRPSPCSPLPSGRCSSPASSRAANRTRSFCTLSAMVVPIPPGPLRHRLWRSEPREAQTISAAKAAVADASRLVSVPAPLVVFTCA